MPGPMPPLPVLGLTGLAAVVGRRRDAFLPALETRLESRRRIFGGVAIGKGANPAPRLSPGRLGIISGGARII